MGLNPTEALELAGISSPNEVGQPTFVEMIIVTNFVGSFFLYRDGFGCNRNCNQVFDFKIHRDLIDPSTVSQARDLLARKIGGVRTPSPTGIKFFVSKAEAAAQSTVPGLDNFRVFRRDFNTNDLTEISMADTVKTKDSIVFIETSVLVSQSALVPGCSTDSNPINRVKQRLAERPDILPTRYLWP